MLSGTGTAEAQKVLNVLSMDVRYASTSGGPLSQSNAKADSEVTFNEGATPLLDLRAINANIYVELDLSTISAIPGLPLTTQDQTELADLQLLLGGKWFEVPSSLIASEVPSSRCRQGQVRPRPGH